MKRGVVVLLALATSSLAQAASSPVSFSAGGHTNYGNWTSSVRFSPAAWKPGETVNVDATLQLAGRHLQTLSGDLNLQPDSFILLVTAERTFDTGGHLRLNSDQTVSTLITPTGLPIEGGPQGALTTRFGGPFKTPLDQFASAPVSSLALMPADSRVVFHASAKLPADLPPGIYRLRLDYGVAQGTRYYTLNGDSFASRPTFRGIEPQSYIYSPPIPADGVSVKGDSVTASTIKPRIPWVILRNYNSNGYLGVVSDEDQPYFALSTRILIQDDVILPRYDANNKPLSYNLEPQFTADTIDDCWNIPWDYASGEMTVQVTGPEGNTVSLGRLPFVRQSGYGPSTAGPPSPPGCRPHMASTR